MSRDPRLPTTWWPVRTYNAVAGLVPGRPAELPGIDELVAAAERVVPGGAADLGDGRWREALQALHASLRTEAALTPAGRRFAAGAIRAGLVNRMQVTRALAADAAVARRPVGPAIVVVGLPRSGTTLLQHLLQLDPDNRSLRQWEAVRPVPAPGTDPAADERRIREAERSTWLIDRLAPQARVLHPTGPLLPTECVTLFNNSFASLELGVIYRIPSYVEWCLQADMRPHYSFYADQLRVLAQAERRPRWALKSPAHLFWLEELAEVLPEAGIVSLRRDPLEVLTSFCRLVLVLSAMTTDAATPAEVGALWSRVWAEGLRRAREARARIPAGRWLDVEYADLVADPVGVVEAIYQAFGHRFPRELAGAIRTHVAAHPGGRSPIEYSLADMGLDAETERRRFAADAALPKAPLPRGRR